MRAVITGVQNLPCSASGPTSQRKFLFGLFRSSVEPDRYFVWWGAALPRGWVVPQILRFMDAVDGPGVGGGGVGCRRLTRSEVVPSARPCVGGLYGGCGPRLWYGRGGVCGGRRGRWRAWLPGRADELRRPGRAGARGRGPAGGAPAGDGDRAGRGGEDPAGRRGGPAGGGPVRGRGVAGGAGAGAGPGAGSGGGGGGAGGAGAAGCPGGGGAGAGAGPAAAAAGAG